MSKDDLPSEARSASVPASEGWYRYGMRSTRAPKSKARAIAAPATCTAAMNVEFTTYAFLLLTEPSREP